jgi:hypothetical protein
MKDGLKALPESVKILPVLVLLLALVLFICAGCGESSGGVKVPVKIYGASSVGSLHMELVFDPAVLEAVGVKPGELAENAMIEHNLQTPGRVIIGIVDASGITGDGTLMEISLDVIDSHGTSELVLEKVEVHDADSLKDIIAGTANGYFSAEDKDVAVPLITLKP